MLKKKSIYLMESLIMVFKTGEMELSIKMNVTLNFKYSERHCSTQEAVSKQDKTYCVC